MRRSRAWTIAEKRIEHKKVESLYVIEFEKEYPVDKAVSRHNIGGIIFTAPIPIRPMCSSTSSLNVSSNISGNSSLST